MLTLDGSYGEGGGQILRTMLTLSVLTGTVVQLVNLRAGRKQPGLRPQHLAAARAAARVCSDAGEHAALTGDALGSQTLTFQPGGVAAAGAYLFDVTEAASGGSAGAVTLILQTVLLPLAFAPGPSTLVLRGGTNVAWSPSALYLEHVYLPALAQMGIAARITGHHWGFYPQGGGELCVEIAGNAAWQPLPAERGARPRGALLGIIGVAYASRLPSHIPQRIANRARNVLARLGVPLDIAAQHVSARDAAAGVFLAARYEHGAAGFSVLGRQGWPSEAVADQACEALLAHHRSGALLDLHLADQLLLPLALAGAAGRYPVAEVTRHLRTNAWVVEQFLPGVVRVEGEEGQTGAIVIANSRL